MQTKHTRNIKKTGKGAAVVIFIIRVEFSLLSRFVCSLFAGRRKGGQAHRGEGRVRKK
jgi:hypothetical protein